MRMRMMIKSRMIEHLDPKVINIVKEEINLSMFNNKKFSIEDMKLINSIAKLLNTVKIKS